MRKLSIITINLNNLEGLKKTMQSVFEQTFTDFEYIVIDGGSTDGSKEYIEKHADRLHYWISEKDDGIYSAMNKGITYATGEYINFLNSGDCYSEPRSLESCNLYERTQQILYGDALMEFVERTIYKSFDFPINFLIMSGGSFVHCATFIKKELFDRIGLYNTDYKIVSDWFFFMRAMFRYNFQTEYLNCCVAIYNMDGISSRQTDLLVQERNEILESEFKHEAELLNMYKDLHNRYNRIISRFPFRQYLKFKIEVSKLLKK